MRSMFVLSSFSLISTASDLFHIAPSRGSSCLSVAFLAVCTACPLTILGGSIGCQLWSMHWISTHHRRQPQITFSLALTVPQSVHYLMPKHLCVFVACWTCTSLQTLQYTLHSMKVTLLAFFRQLDFSLETRHLQGHNTFAASSTLYGRDDVSPLIIAQDSFITRVLQGWRVRTPMMRGVTFMPSEPPLVWAQEIGSVASIPALAFFRFSEERNRPTAVASPLAGESDQLHSAPALASQPAPAGGTPGSSIGRRD